MNSPRNRPTGARREELDVASLGLGSPAGPPTAAPRKKRRWWLYLLIAAGSLLVLALVGVIGIVLYAKSLVSSYTAPAPKPFPKAVFDPEKQKEFVNRWTDFSRAVQARQAPAPFVITADDINLAISQNKDLRDRLRVVITNSRVLVEFSFPLDQSGVQQLKGRYINGVAKLDVVFKDGWLNVNVGSVDANGRPLPGWILSRLRQENLGKFFDRNRDVVNAFQEIESIKVEGSSIVVTPASAK